jgi:hypothetical protein
VRSNIATHVVTFASFFLRKKIVWIFCQFPCSTFLTTNTVLRFCTVSQVAAQTGHHVTIVEVNEDAIKKANNGIQSSLQRVAKKLYKVYLLYSIDITFFMRRVKRSFILFLK